jgi:hypothetical protein
MPRQKRTAGRDESQRRRIPASREHVRIKIQSSPAGTGSNGPAPARRGRQHLRQLLHRRLVLIRLRHVGIVNHDSQSQPPPSRSPNGAPRQSPAHAAMWTATELRAPLHRPGFHHRCDHCGLTITTPVPAWWCSSRSVRSAPASRARRSAPSRQRPPCQRTGVIVNHKAPRKKQRAVSRSPQ